MMKRVDLVKAGGFSANEHLTVAEVPVPEPSDNEVVIDIKASAINPVDFKQAEYNIMLPKELPGALGCDIAGVVVKTSEATKEWMGKSVFAYVGADKTKFATSRGTFAEQIAVGVDIIAEMPEGMSFAQASSLPVGALTAELLLKDHVAMEAGDFVVIWGGSSSVGYNAVQLAAKRGYKPIAIASSKHTDTMKSLGAVEVVDYRGDDVPAKVADICKAASGNLNGAVDCIGDSSSFKPCVEMVKALGDSAKADKLGVSTVNGFSQTPPDGVKMFAVDLGSALDKEDIRKLVQEWMPEVAGLKTMPIQSIEAEAVTAEVVEKAFQKMKDGVSGEKLVIEWK